MNHQIEVYGTSSCQDTQSTRRHLDELAAPYQYIDIEADPAAARKVEEWNGGERKTPTVVLAGTDECDGLRILSVPSDSLLDAEMDHRRLLPRSSGGDGSTGIER